ncbi:MAG: hypothetical protein ACREM3_09990 [Candidatus Rokuibacteriota bacterium]
MIIYQVISLDSLKVQSLFRHTSEPEVPSNNAFEQPPDGPVTLLAKQPTRQALGAAHRARSADSDRSRG